MPQVSFRLDFNFLTVLFLQTWYNYSDVFDAWERFLRPANKMEDNPAYLHDLVDITRQALQIYGEINYKMLLPFFMARDSESFKYVRF